MNHEISVSRNLTQRHSAADAATKGARTALSAGCSRAGRDSRTRLSALRENLRRAARCWEIALQRTQRLAEIGRRKFIRLRSALLRVLCVSAFAPVAFTP